MPRRKQATPKSKPRVRQRWAEDAYVLEVLQSMLDLQAGMVTALDRLIEAADKLHAILAARKRATMPLDLEATDQLH